MKHSATDRNELFTQNFLVGAQIRPISGNSRPLRKWLVPFPAPTKVLA